MNLATVQYAIDRADIGALLTALERDGLREKNGHVYVPKGHKETAAQTAAINYLVSEWDYSAGEEAETERIDHA